MAEQRNNNIDLYLKDICALYDVPKNLEKLLRLLLLEVTTTDNLILLTQITRNQLSADLGITLPTLQNKLRELVKLGLLINDHTKFYNQYIVNKKIMGNGAMQLQNKLPLTTIAYIGGKREIIHRFNNRGKPKE